MPILAEFEKKRNNGSSIRTIFLSIKYAQGIYCGNFCKSVQVSLFKVDNIASLFFFFFNNRSYMEMSKLMSSFPFHSDF